MMKKELKLVSTMLCVLLLESTVTSCGKEINEPSKTSNSETLASEAVSEETEPADGRTPHKVPTDTLNFDGNEFRMHAADFGGYRYYFFADEEIGEVMNDAIYRRKQFVEDALNVKIISDLASDYINGVVADVIKSVSADQDDYSWVFLHCITGVSDLVSNGYLYNLDLLPYVDMEAEWWNRKQMDQLRLGKNTYYAVNDFMIPDPFCVYFNKNIIAELDMEDPYQLVYDGTWTIDKMVEMARKAQKDLDGDGKFTNADRYGMTILEEALYNNFVTGANQFFTERDESGKLAITINSQKMQKLVEIFASLYNENYIYSIKDEGRPSIDNGRTLFTLYAVSDAQGMRNYTADFGILPYPKYDDAQENYVSLDWGGLSCVPTTIKNPEMVSAVMELLAWKSAEEVIPTYYDKVLVGKLARDKDSEKMLDILFDTIVYEVGINYFGHTAGIGDVFFALSKVAITGKSTDLASWAAKKEKPAANIIKKFYENLEAVENE